MVPAVQLAAVGALEGGVHVLAVQHPHDRGLLGPAEDHRARHVRGDGLERRRIGRQSGAGGLRVRMRPGWRVAGQRRLDGFAVRPLGPERDRQLGRPAPPARPRPPRVVPVAGAAAGREQAISATRRTRPARPCAAPARRRAR